MIGSSKIIKEINLEEFEQLIAKHKENIILGQHCLDHLNNAQRKLFKEADLINILLKEKPNGIGLQANGRYCPLYKRKWGFIRIIIEAKTNRLEIVTYTNPSSMPNLKRLEEK